MAGAHIQVRWLSADPLNVQRGIFGHVTHVSGEEFDALAAQALQQLHPVADFHAQRDLRMLLPQFAQRLRHERGRQQWPDTEGRVAQLAVAVEVDIPLQAARFEQQVPRSLDDEFACGGGAHIPGFTIEQADAQRIFHRLDAATEGGLAQVNAFGSAGEVERVSQGNNVTQAAQIHVLRPLH